tara:strand:- start:25 stop:702 length:678 start_codon:yes stop_codon:yes gene_type:complete
MENEAKKIPEDFELFLGVNAALDQLTKAAQLADMSVKKIKQRKMENKNLDPLSGYMNKVIEKNDSKVIELQAQDVTSKEEQLITRKRTANMFLDDVERQIDQGNLLATFAALQIKQLKKALDNTLARIEDKAKDELTGTEHYIYGDHKLVYKQGSKTLDYGECEEILIMEKHLKELKGKYKAALEGVEKGITQVVEGHKFVDVNGEILSLPKWKYNKSSIQLTKV